MTVKMALKSIAMVYLLLLWDSWWPTALSHVPAGSSLQLPPTEVLSVVTASFLTPAQVVASVMDERGGRDEKLAKGEGGTVHSVGRNEPSRLRAFLSTAPSLCRLRGWLCR